MEIDVIIPLYKPGKELFTLLDKLGSQSVPVHQVILLNTEEKYIGIVDENGEMLGAIQVEPRMSS